MCIEFWSRYRMLFLNLLPWGGTNYFERVKPYLNYTMESKIRFIMTISSKRSPILQYHCIAFHGWEQLIYLPVRPWSSIKHTPLSSNNKRGDIILKVTWSSSSRWSWAEARALSASSSSHTMSVTMGPLVRDPLSSTNRKLSVVVSFSKPCNTVTVTYLWRWPLVQDPWQFHDWFTTYFHQWPSK